jgi:hypothetical protein
VKHKILQKARSEDVTPVFGGGFGHANIWNLECSERTAADVGAAEGVCE